MKTESFRSRFRKNLRVFSLARQISPGWIPLTISKSILAASIPYVTIFFSARIISELSGPCRPRQIEIYVFLALLSYAMLTAALRWLERKRDVLDSLEWSAWTKLLSDKRLSMDFQDLDDPHIMDQYSQIIQNNRYNGGGYCRAVWSMDGAFTALIGVICAISLSVSLFMQKTSPGSPYGFLDHPLALAVVVIALLLTVTISPMIRTRSYDLMYGQTELATFDNRVFFHFRLFCIKRPECAMDIRIYEHQKISRDYIENDTVWDPGGPLAKISWGEGGLLEVLAEFISILAVILIYAFVCLKALGGAFGIGEVTQYVGAITALALNLSDLFNEIGRLHHNTKHLDRLYEYLDLPNRMYRGSLTTEKRSDRRYEVEFRDVSFRYPGSDQWALRHVSMKFSVGQRLAIVGENGSGKTTFIKLLCRLYDPTEGQILLNGIDIRKYDYQDYMQIFSVVFQDYKLLSFPLGQNVAAAESYKKDRALRSLADSGFDERLNDLPKGLDTCLGLDFEEDGIELSGGESQKVAIARALYKDGSFLILDEPTASLDPIAEAEIYEKFNDISGDRTAIYISHRLSSCKFCDEIVVFDEGQIVQKGSHEELLADECGKYHELWTSQAKYYQ